MSKSRAPCRTEVRSPGRVGGIELIFGPMFSGKTSRLIAEISSRADLGFRVLYINHSIDDRKTTNTIASMITTHSSTRKVLDPKIKVIRTDLLSKVNVNEYDVIGIDEAQFYDDLYDQVSKWMLEGKTVYCAALNGTKDLKQFGQTYLLLPLVSNIHFCKAACELCIDLLKQNGVQQPLTGLLSAPFTGVRKAVSGQIKVGGAETYIPLCESHHAQNRVAFSH